MSEPEWLTIADLVRTRSIAELQEIERAIRLGRLGIYASRGDPDPFTVRDALKLRLGGNLGARAIEAAAEEVAKTNTNLAAAFKAVKVAEENAITASLLTSGDEVSEACGRRRKAVADAAADAATADPDAALTAATDTLWAQIKAIEKDPSFRAALGDMRSRLVDRALAWSLIAEADMVNDSWLLNHPNNKRRIGASELLVRSADLARVLGVAVDPETDATEAGILEACESLRGKRREIRTAIAGGVIRWFNATGADTVPRSIPWSDPDLQGSIKAFGACRGLAITIERADKLDPWVFTTDDGGRDDSKTCQRPVRSVLVEVWSRRKSTRHDPA